MVSGLQRRLVNDCGLGGTRRFIPHRSARGSHGGNVLLHTALIAFPSSAETQTHTFLTSTHCYVPNYTTSMAVPLWRYSRYLRNCRHILVCVPLVPNLISSILRRHDKHWPECKTCTSQGHPNGQSKQISSWTKPGSC